MLRPFLVAALFRLTYVGVGDVSKGRRHLDLSRTFIIRLRDSELDSELPVTKSMPVFSQRRVLVFRGCVLRFTTECDVARGFPPNLFRDLGHIGHSYRIDYVVT